jgi:ABC-type Fe3+ transport system substrate-binding protein
MNRIARFATRRRFLETSLATTAVIAAARTPARAAGKSSWESQWSDLQTAARKEGTISIMSTVGTSFRSWAQAAQDAMPGITIDLEQQPNSEQIANKILAERAAGVYSFDLIIMAAVSALPRLKPVGAVDKLRPLLFRPDVLDNRAWNGGFDTWADNEKSYGFPIAASPVMPAINTDLVHPGDLKDARSLLDPKWKGKIMLGDLRSGAERVLMTSIRLRDGDDAVKRLIIDQKPTIVLDVRQIAEGLVRGTCAIGHGLAPPNMREFVDAGLAKNVRFVDIPDVTFITYTFSLWAANRPPHPNATKLFANWMLTKPGMQLLSSNLNLNVRRSDVPIIDPNAVTRPSQHYFFSSSESALPEIEKTRALVTRITGEPG